MALGPHHLLLCVIHTFSGTSSIPWSRSCLYWAVLKGKGNGGSQTTEKEWAPLVSSLCFRTGKDVVVHVSFSIVCSGTTLIEVGARSQGGEAGGEEEDPLLLSCGFGHEEWAGGRQWRVLCLLCLSYSVAMQWQWASTVLSHETRESTLQRSHDTQEFMYSPNKFC